MFMVCLCNYFEISFSYLYFIVLMLNNIYFEVFIDDCKSIYYLNL